MTKKRRGPERLVGDIFATGEDEIQCDEARVLIAACLDSAFNDEQAQRQYPALWRHFRFCSDCAAEYRLLMEITAAERAGQLDREIRVPPLPDQGRPPIWARAKEALSALLPGFTPALAIALARGEEAGFEPVEVSLASGGITISFNLMINDEEANLRDLICTVSPADPTAAASLEGSPVWLQAALDGPAIQEQSLSEAGDATFSRLAAGIYTFRLRFASQEYLVDHIVIP